MRQLFENLLDINGSLSHSYWQFCITCDDILENIMLYNFRCRTYLSLIQYFGWSHHVRGGL